MEKNKELLDGVREHIRGVIDPILDKALKEMPKNQVLVGGLVQKGVFYNPGNYRLYIPFSMSSRIENLIRDENSSYIKTNLKGVGFKSSYNVNHGSETVIMLEEWTIRIKRRFLDVLHGPTTKRWIHVPDLAGREALVNFHAEIDAMALDFAGEICGLLGLDFVPVIGRRSGEYKVRGDEFIDKIPADLRFHCDVGKKVYPDRDFEFYSPGYVANYLESRAVSDLEFVAWDDLRRPVDFLKRRVACVDDLLDYGFLVRGLGDDEKAEIEVYLFTLKQ